MAIALFMLLNQAWICLPVHSKAKQLTASWAVVKESAVFIAGSKQRVQVARA